MVQDGLARLLIVALGVGAAGAACNGLTGGDDVQITTTSAPGGASTTTSAGEGGGGAATTTSSSSSSATTGAGGGGAASSGGGGSTATTTTTTTETTTTTTTTTTLLHECPPAGGQDCTPGDGTPGPGDCGDDPSCFWQTVVNSINGIISANPAEFYPVPDHSDCLAPYDVVWFMDAVVAAIQAQGLCVTRDPPDSQEEVSVKLNNSYAENFDIVASWGCARTGGGIYTGFCTNVWW